MIIVHFSQLFTPFQTLIIQNTLCFLDKFDAVQSYPHCFGQIQTAYDENSALLDAFAERRCINGLDNQLQQYSTSYLSQCKKTTSLLQKVRFLTQTGVPTTSCVDSALICPITCDDGSSISLFKATGTSMLLLSQFEQKLVNEGPFTVQMQYYQDLNDYTTGIYEHKSGILLDTVTVDLVGYDTDYWICKGWFGKQWGVNGYFKIRKGTNECGIEEETVTVKVK
ncbi:Cathepsin_B [Hexamita inflata]|uniref:Cathepsin B n=1 Tax=Hexamita inflata TaxID=28002 RepID=A0AA86UD51_9EUKA|nr:Cathepsin B [Hexamita inflata]